MSLNPRVGTYYLAGGLLLIALAFLLRPWGWAFLWPACSVILVSLGYFRWGSRIYGKREGRHPFLFRTLHLFTTWGHEISRRAYARQCSAWDEVTPRLWIGRQLNSGEAEKLKSKGVVATLDLTAEFSEPTALLRSDYLNLPLLDLTAPSDAQLDRALEFISEAIEKGVLYIHCKIGYSRTAAITGSYLIHSGTARTAEEAIGILKRARPSIVIRPEAYSTIQRFAQRCQIS